MKEDEDSNDRQKFSKASVIESKGDRIILFRNFFIIIHDCKTEGTSASTDKFKIFEKWLTDNGTTYPKLELQVTVSRSI